MLASSSQSRNYIGLDNERKDVNSASPIDGDDSLARRLHRGDERALEECYRDQSSVVKLYVARFVPLDDVDDVVQQVFIELWRSHRRYDPTRNLTAFVLGIARKRSIDYLRKRRDTVVDVAHFRELVADDGRDFINRLVWMAEVRRGLNSLPNEQRQTLEMIYFDDLTQQETATQLGVALGTVKARASRGMRKMADTLENMEMW